MGEKKETEVEIRGEYHKNPGWQISGKDGDDTNKINPRESIVEFTERRIKELQKTGKKINWYPQD